MTKHAFRKLALILVLVIAILSSTLASGATHLASERELTPAAWVPPPVAMGKSAVELSPPVLYPIEDEEQDGCYTVGWQPVDGAERYVLEEAVASSVTYGHSVYSGPNLSWTTVGREAGSYHYRVWAGGADGGSDWSSAESVTVEHGGCVGAGPPANSSFEGLHCDPGSPQGRCFGNWTDDTHDGIAYDTIQSPQGWTTWWREDAGFARPTVKPIPNEFPYDGPPARIRSGNYAAQLYTQHANHDAGFYQVVNGLEPGAIVEFSAYAHGWSSESRYEAYSGGDPWAMIFQVGIAPTGACDPFYPYIAWSPAVRAPDEFVFIGPVRAQVGGGGSVCVILRSKTKGELRHLDAYWDDATLLVTP